MPEEQVQDVQVDPSTTEIEQGVNQDQEVAQPEPTVEEASTNIPEPEPGQAPVDEVDDIGVPWKNRYMESQRKMEKLAESLENIEKKIANPQSERKPTVGELRAFAQQAEDPAHVQWAYDEIHKLEQEESKSLVQQELNSWREQQKQEEIKAKTFESVINRNPDLAIKDQAGNFVKWNAKSPLFQRMNQYMQNPRIANQPDALDIAEAYAMRDLARASTPQTMQKIESLKNENSSLQKKTLVEGGGNSPMQKLTPRQIAIDKSKSGELRDGAVAMKEILRSQGVIKEE